MLEAGLQWLVRAVEESRHRQAAAIGLHLARLWYCEKVYPLAFTVSALGQAVKLLFAASDESQALGRQAAL